MAMSNREMLMAADWLDCYEGDELGAVADFLRKTARTREIARLARQHKTTPAIMRKVMERLGSVDA